MESSKKSLFLFLDSLHHIEEISKQWQVFLYYHMLYLIGGRLVIIV